MSNTWREATPCSLLSVRHKRDLALITQRKCCHYVLCVVFNTHKKKNLGDYLRKRRSERQRENGRKFSLRQVAVRIGVEPSYLSKIERGLEPHLSEKTTRALAAELDEDPDLLLAMAGKVSSDLQDIIRKRPQLFSQLIRELKNMPDRAVLRLVREVRDGSW